MDKYKSDLDDRLLDIQTEIDLDEKCAKIEKALVEATRNNQPPQQYTKSHGADHTTLNDLISQRQSMSHDSTASRSAISKRIQKEIKRIKKPERRARIEAILQSFTGLKRITHIKSRRRRNLITHMTNKEDKEVTDRQSIADVFADFYDDLYATRHGQTSAHSSDFGDPETIPPFTAGELEEAVRHLRNGRSKDGAGVIAEMIKAGGEALIAVLLDLFNQVIAQNGSPPQTWRQTTITVLYKSGNPQLPQNYRPIAMIPLLYKLFARLLYSRLLPILDKAQSHDQAGFRRGYCTEDHLFTFTCLEEKAREWQRPLWIAALDFKKAFDTVEHSCLWEALRQQQVPNSYVKLLHTLYAQQSATVKTDRVSRPFSIQRGTKQGDPLSSLLFNSLLEHIMSDVKPTWVEKKWGIQLGHGQGSHLTNLRFADDVLLVSTSLHRLKSMLSQLSTKAKTTGLELHPDKTKILTNTTQKTGRPKHSTISVNDMDLEILPMDGSVKYLGRLISFENAHEKEIDHRIRVAWAAFMAHKGELTSKNYTLRHRTRLFESTVTPAFLYGIASLVLTKESEAKIQRTQRRMLRMMLGAGRRKQPNNDSEHKSSDDADDNNATEQAFNRHGDSDVNRSHDVSDDNDGNGPHDTSQSHTSPAQQTIDERDIHIEDIDDACDLDDSSDDDVDSNEGKKRDEPDCQSTTPTDDQDELEPWTEWIRRVTRIAEAQLTEMNIDNWVTACRRRKFRWARRTATLEPYRWAAMSMRWNPPEHSACTRRQARPKLRWEDNLNKFTSAVFGESGADWKELACDGLLWQTLEDEFVKGEWPEPN